MGLIDSPMMTSEFGRRGFLRGWRGAGLMTFELTLEGIGDTMLHPEFFGILL